MEAEVGANPLGNKISAPPLASEILAKMTSRPSRAAPAVPSHPSQPPLASEILRHANERYLATRTAPRHMDAPPLAGSILSSFGGNQGRGRNRNANVSQRRAAPAAAAAVVSPKAHVAAAAAARIYPNLHPGANTPADPENVFHLREVAGGYRAQQGHSSRWTVPNLKYNFVTTLEGDLVMHHRYRHPPLAGGRPVLYAGEAEFNNGKLSWWSNASGHYRPDGEDAGQAGLPMDGFYPYDQVLRGVHKRKAPPLPAKSSSSE